jgi:hypothetical protein
MVAATACDYEGAGPAGTTLTDPNTGGVVAIGAGAAAVSTAVAAFGQLAGQFDVPAANVSSRVTSPVVGGTLQIQISFKFRIPTGFATTKRILIVQNTTPGTVCSINYNGTTNRIQLQNAAGAGTVTVTETLALNTWYRVELNLLIASSVTGAYVLNLYAEASKTPLNAVPFTGSTYDLGTVAVGGLQHGINSNGTSVAATVLIDSVRYEVGGTTDLGPEIAPVTGLVAVGLASASTPRKAAPASGTAVAGLSSRGAAVKAAAAVGRAPVGFATRATLRKASAATGVAGVGFTGSAVARKLSTATGRALIGFLSERSIRRQRGTAHPGRRRPATIQSVERTRP